MPTLDAAFEAYKLAMVWALVIGWFCVRPDYYSPMIVCANLERILTAVNDHDVLDRVERLL